MSQRVIIRFGAGSCEQGFPAVFADLYQSEGKFAAQMGSLPPAPGLSRLYDQWRSLYEALYHNWRMRRGWVPEIEFVEDDDNMRISRSDFEDLCQELRREINTWLDSRSFGRIERQLRAQLSPEREVRVIVETKDERLRHLPWHLWNFFEDFPKAEIALSSPDRHELPSPNRRRKKVKILAILGNSQGIEVHKDRTILEQLPDAKTVFLVEPRRQELDRWLWQESWDILFFAGHSASTPDGSTGHIEINAEEALAIPDLKNALKAAVRGGLQFAIFNSCDGLGLANRLSALNIPQLIVMREPVPDRVAQEFLMNWIGAFSAGKPFYLSVREAREKLQGLEGEFPCACWLPVIFQNCWTGPPSWRELTGKIDDSPDGADSARIARGVAVGLAVGAVVVGMRLAGWLQPSELMAFDHLMRSRPAEDPDPRMLAVEVTGADVQNQPPEERLGRSISPRVLEELLEKLQPLEPRAIGLDIYQEVPVGPERGELIDHLRNNDRFITVCKVGEGDDSPGIPAAPHIPRESLWSRVGFSNAILDPDGVLRRQLIGQAPPMNSRCPVNNSLNLRVAIEYLKAAGLLTDADLKVTRNTLHLGDLTLRTIGANIAGYHQIDAAGYQIMINYRNTRDRKVARTLTLGEALNGGLTPELVRDRIVLIGTTDKTFRDLHRTPYSRESYPDIPGVIVQAHAISQIVSAVEDGRPLIWWWPLWGELLWIGGWSLAGSAIALVFHRHRWIGLGLGCGLVVLYGCCYVVLWQTGGWIPLVPPVLALVGSGSAIAVYRSLQLQIVPPKFPFAFQD
ncbi:MAG: CHASE2 domain-containing protein [Limnospira sp.]